MLTIYANNLSPKLQQNVDKNFTGFSVNQIPDIFSKVDFSEVNEPAVEWYLLISFYIFKLFFRFLCGKVWDQPSKKN